MMMISRRAEIRCRDLELACPAINNKWSESYFYHPSSHNVLCDIYITRLMYLFLPFKEARGIYRGILSLIRMDKSCFDQMSKYTSLCSRRYISKCILNTQPFVGVNVVQYACVHGASPWQQAGTALGNNARIIPKTGFTERSHIKDGPRP